MQFDSCNKLRRFKNIESCVCGSVDRLLLVYMLTDNPIHCFRCKCEVDPAKIALTDEQVEDVYEWHRVNRALNDLWLDSGEYEAWARAQLLDPSGQVNLAGMKAAASLSQRVETYLWWFHDEEDAAPQVCPVCHRKLNPATGHGHGQCDVCRIVI